MAKRELVFAHTDSFTGWVCKACGWMLALPRFVDQHSEPSIQAINGDPETAFAHVPPPQPFRRLNHPAIRQLY